MDKYEYKVRMDEIKSLIAKRDFVKAVEIADTIDFRRVRSVSTLCTMSDLYKINRRYKEAKELLLQAYEKYPGGRTIVYSLCELSLKIDDIVSATEYYKEFVQLAPTDNGKFVLQYKIYEATGASLEERIEVLEELKKREYREKWGYELAYLYHRVGLATKCTEECDELILWFREGKYVKKAMELKMLHQQLTSEQERLYNIMDPNAAIPASATPEATAEEPAVAETPVEEAPVEEPAVEEKTKEFEPVKTFSEDDIQVKTIDMSKYGTINLQKEIAKGIQAVMFAEEGMVESEEAVSEEVPSQEPLNLTQEIIAPTMQNQGTDRIEELFFADTTSQNASSADYQKEVETVFNDEVTQEAVSAEEPAEEEPAVFFRVDAEDLVASPTEEVDDATKMLMPLLAENMEDVVKIMQTLNADNNNDNVVTQESVEMEEIAETEEPTEEQLEAVEELSGVDAELAKIEAEIAEMEKEDGAGAALEEALLAEIEELAEVEAEIAAEDEVAEVDEVETEKVQEEPSEEELEEVEELVEIEEVAETEESVVMAEPEVTLQMQAEPVEVEEVTTPTAEEPSDYNNFETEELPFFLDEDAERAAMTEEDARKLVEAAKGPIASLIRAQVAEAVESAMHGQNVVTAPVQEVKSTPDLSKVEPPSQMGHLLSQEYDGQISLVVPENEGIEKQITGQLNLEDVLVEWEKIKKENEEKRKEDVKQRVLQHTGAMFTEFDIIARDGMLEQLEKENLISDEEEKTEESAVEELVETEEIQDAAETEEVDVTEESANEEPVVDDVVVTEEIPEEEELVITPPVAVPPIVAPAPEMPVEEPVIEEPVIEQPIEEEAIEASPEMPVESDQTQITVSNPREVAPKVDEDGNRVMTDEEVMLFAPFVQTKSARIRLMQSLDKISLVSYTGNVFVTGDYKESVELAKNVLREVQITDRNFSGKVAKVSGSALNDKDVEDTVYKLENGGLIIEKASEMNAQTTKNLLRVLNQGNRGIVVILQDNKKNMHRMMEYFDGMKDIINVHIEVEELGDDALVAYGKKYAKHMEYSIDEMGILALHRRIDEMQTSDHVVTVADVREIVDEAIANANKKSFKHFTDVLFAKRYDEEDMIILRERDF